MRLPATAIVAAVAALLSLLLFVTIPGDGLWRKVLLDAAHGPIFAAVAVLLMLLQPPAVRTRRKAYVTAFLAALGLGIMIEILQSFAGRPGSLFDVMTDAAGILTGLASWALLAGGPAAPAARRPWTLQSSWPVAIALAGATIIAWEPLQAARAYADRAASFPTIAQFRESRDLAFTEPQGASAEVVELPDPWSRTAGERALRITYADRQPRAVQVVEPSSDWRGYSAVAVDITNPGESELRLTFRIFDAAHRMDYRDRLNLPIAIPGRTRATVRVALVTVEAAPQSRRMDLSRVADVMLFGQPGDGAGEFYLSRLWLE
jgi:hypothetical protein